MARPVCRKRGSPNGLASPRAHRPDAEHTNPQGTAGDLGTVPTFHDGILALQGGEEVHVARCSRWVDQVWKAAIAS